MAKLAGGPDPDRARRTLRDQQRPQAFDIAGATLGVPARSSRQRRPGGLDRVELVGLAVAATFLPVRPIDLNDRDARGGEMSRQTGAIGASALHADPLKRTERAQPRQQPVIARRRRGKRPHTQQPTDRIDRRRDMHIEMRVNTTNNQARNFYDGHRHPFSR